MYANETILTLKEQRPSDPETDEDFPYNRVLVIGPSPVNHGDKGDFKGADAAGVIIRPLTNFGATLDEPYGKINLLYDVESIPEQVTEVTTTVKTYDANTAAAGPTPEEVFAKEAPGKPSVDGERVRTSPLGDNKDPRASGPLGDVEAPPAEPEPTRDDASPL